MKLRRSPFAALQAAADSRRATEESFLAQVRAARLAYDADPSPKTHRDLARCVGLAVAAGDPSGHTHTARYWRRR